MNVRNKWLGLALAAGVLGVAAVQLGLGWHPGAAISRGAENAAYPRPGDPLDAKDFERLIPLHRVKTSPVPGDWLATYPEEGQTFSDYLAMPPPRPGAGRNVLYLVLIGDFDEVRQKAILQTAEVLEASFGLKTKFLPPIPLSVIPPSAQRVHPATADHQLLTRYIMEKVLRPIKPADAFCLLAFTASDLWPGEGWNFVFGEASPQDRLGIWSLYRYGDPGRDPESYRLFLKRTIKIATHEAGHLFGLGHCIYYECNMNGSNHLAEADRQPLCLCPVCLRKLTWATGQDPPARFERLAPLFGRLGLKEEEAFFRESLRLLRPGPGTESR